MRVVQQAGMHDVEGPWLAARSTSTPFAEERTFTDLCAQQLLGILVPGLKHLVPVACRPGQPLCCHIPAIAHASSTVTFHGLDCIWYTAAFPVAHVH